MFNNVFNGKRVFVTGHTGFKGAWLTLWLKRLGAEVRGFSNEIPTSPSLFQESGLEKELSFTPNDIRDLSMLQRELNDFRPEIVFHLAAEAVVRTCYDDPKLAFTTNLMGTINMLEAIRHTDYVKAAVFITSDKCYENVEWEYGYRETDKLGGKDPYSASKACAEVAIATYYRSYFAEQENVLIASTRAGNVIGGGDWAVARIVPDCVRAWSKGEEVEIRSPYATRPWQHVLEPLSGYMQLASDLYLRKDGLHGEAFNFGPKKGADIPVVELLAEMKETWESGEFRVNNPKNEMRKEATLLKLSCDKAHSRLQWEGVLSFDESVKMTTEWYRDYHQGKDTASQLTVNDLSLFESLAKERGHRWANGQ